jgi:endonuclease/exonuclease/phosphatase family metal-dependent hydrolase
MLLKLVTYNLHKGKNILGFKYCFKELKKFLDREEFDIGFFQEILGENITDPSIPKQIESLADEKWTTYSFAKNSIVSNHEHGNLILSKYPILSFDICDLSLSKLEKRSALIAQIKIGEISYNFICTHLNLRQKDRYKQIDILLEFIKDNYDEDTPTILAGDINDWNGNVSQYIREKAGFFTLPEIEQLKTFPSLKPVLALDRFFFHKVKMEGLSMRVPSDAKKYSDHLPLFCEFTIRTEQ